MTSCNDSPGCGILNRLAESQGEYGEPIGISTGSWHGGRPEVGGPCRQVDPLAGSIFPKHPHPAGPDCPPGGRVRCSKQPRDLTSSLVRGFHHQCRLGSPGSVPVPREWGQLDPQSETLSRTYRELETELILLKPELPKDAFCVFTNTLRYCQYSGFLRGRG